jgi:hypothetical protein
MILELVDSKFIEKLRKISIILLFWDSPNLRALHALKSDWTWLDSFSTCIFVSFSLQMVLNKSDKICTHFMLNS